MCAWQETFSLWTHWRLPCLHWATELHWFCIVSLSLSLSPVVELIAWTSGTPGSVLLRDADYIYSASDIPFCSRVSASWQPVLFLRGIAERHWAGSINAECPNQSGQALVRDGSLPRRLILQYCDVLLCCHFVPGYVARFTKWHEDDRGAGCLTATSETTFLEPTCFLTTPKKKKNNVH